MARSRWTGLRILPTVVAIALAGACSGEVSCGGSNKIDGRKAEKLLEGVYKKNGTTVSNITCPDGLKKKKGATFICHVTAENGDIINVEFTQTDGDGYVQVTKEDVIVRTGAIGEQLRKLAKDSPNTSKLEFTSFECPKEQKAVTGNVFECKGMTKNEGVLLFRVELTDDKGTARFGFFGKVAAPETLESVLVAGLKEKSIEATVDCGTEPVRLIDKRVVECQAVDGKEKAATIEIIPKGPLGAFDWRVKK